MASPTQIKHRGRSTGRLQISQDPDWTPSVMLAGLLKAIALLLQHQKVKFLPLQLLRAVHCGQQEDVPEFADAASGHIKSQACASCQLEGIGMLCVSSNLGVQSAQSGAGVAQTGRPGAIAKYQARGSCDKEKKVSTTQKACPRL